MNKDKDVIVVEDEKKEISGEMLKSLLEVPTGKPASKIGVTRKDKSKGKTKRNKTAKKSRKINHKISKKNTRRSTGSKKRK